MFKKVLKGLAIFCFSWIRYCHFIRWK